jgi:hypothetical protein
MDFGVFPSRFLFFLFFLFLRLFFYIILEVFLKSNIVANVKGASITQTSNSCKGGLLLP